MTLDTCALNSNYLDISDGRFYNLDTFKAMEQIADSSIDMLLVDLPYGTTACSWDKNTLSLPQLWAEYNRICKKNAAMVFTAAQPFTTMLLSSNIKNFKYCWYWKKRPVNFLNAKHQPLRNIEDVLVFCNGKLPYFPQNLVSTSRINKRSNSTETNNIHGKENISKFTGYPTQLIEIMNGERGLHPTQKPVELFEYLIRTYTSPGETVLDNTAGSGTTAVAAINCNRKWICIEKDQIYYNKAIERIQSHNFAEAVTPIDIATIKYNLHFI